jgi:hypothetical protein
MYAGLERNCLWAEPFFGSDHVKPDWFITNALSGYRFREHHSSYLTKGELS